MEYYVNYEYISEVLCINKDEPMTMCKGSCYLAEQIDLFEGNQNSGEGIPIENKVETKAYTYLAPEKIALNSLHSDILGSYLISGKQITYIAFLEVITPPPELLA
ncbi:MAG: hypothetical protein DRI71_07500 [Bacteroidetes bacterium]|nr:MAG: hypothetical protein DRI71_07500 [Bacteroidota bacterium]